jgi:GntR family transcriptional regulator, transcriptional repressor for pyruvate dehydrogenase complex
MRQVDLTRSPAVERVGSELFRPITTRAAFESVVRQIIGLIQGGRLSEGDVLPGERVLASLMQVSRPTIRLAIATLAKEGLVEVRPGRAGGIVLISRWVPPHLEEDWSVELGVDELFELLEARRALEPRVAQLAAMRGTAAQFDEMRETLALQKAHLSDRPKAIQAELMFHRQMWHAAGNAELEAMLARLFRRMSTVLDMAMRTQADQQSALELNQATLEVIARADSREVNTAMGEHMAYLERIVEETFGRSRIRHMPDFLIDSAD